MAKEIQESVTVTIKRSQIVLNPLNPKVHTDEEIKAQKENIKRVGALGGIVWNMETQHLLDGHRRVAALDSIHKYDGTDKTDYDIKVEKVEFDDKTEKEQLLYMAMGNTKVDFNLAAKFIDDVEYEHLGIGMDDYNAILELRDFDEDVPLMEMEMPKGMSELKAELEPKEADSPEKVSISVPSSSEKVVKPVARETFYSNGDEVINPDSHYVPEPVNEMTEAELLEEGTSHVEDAELKKNLTKINKEYTQDVAERRTSKLALIGAIHFEDEKEKETFCDIFGIMNEFNISINARDILELWQNHQK